MQVGIIGSGVVAQTLASGFLKHGHSVTVGSREPRKLADWQSANPAAKTGNFAETAAFGGIIVLAVKGTAALDALRLAGAVHLRGKTIIDTTNPIEDAPPDHGVLRFFTRQNESLLEQLQAGFPDAHLVKAFNSVGAARMINPHFAEGKPTMFICGNDSAAKLAVANVLDAFGWETADMGAAQAARAIEPLCMLWCIPGFLRNQWTHAFKLLF